LCYSWPEMDAKVGHLQCKCLRPLTVRIQLVFIVFLGGNTEYHMMKD
jgi:hypothetical protein